MSISPPYSELRDAYPSNDVTQSGYISSDDLYRSIGWDDFMGDPNYANTCAVRVSLAFVRAGYRISPRSHRILKGDHSGEGVQVRMSSLASLLATERYLGNYEVLASRSLGAALATRQGVVAFHGIAGYSGGGHIDLITGSGSNSSCASSCYWGADEVWFWPLARGTS